MQRLAWMMFTGVAIALTGCSGFFVPVVPVPPASTGNYVYVANSTANSVSGFAVGTEKLTAVAEFAAVPGIFAYGHGSDDQQ